MTLFFEISCGKATKEKCRNFECSSRSGPESSPAIAECCNFSNVVYPFNGYTMGNGDSCQLTFIIQKETILYHERIKEAVIVSFKPCSIVVGLNYIRQPDNTPACSSSGKVAHISLVPFSVFLNHLLIFSHFVAW